MSDSLPVTDDPDADDKDQQIADLRALVEQLSADQTAKAAEVPVIASTPAPVIPDYPERLNPDDNQGRAQQFARDLVTDVHEHDRQEARRRLAEQGLDRWEGPLPEGTVTVDVAEAQGRGRA